MCSENSMDLPLLAENPDTRNNDRGSRMQANKKNDEAKKTQLDFDRSLSNARLLEPMVQAQKNTGKSPFRISAEILRLNFGKSRLTPPEYFKYNLFDKKEDEKTKFIGVKRGTAINLRANFASQLSHLVNNKLLFESVLRGLGIRTTRTQAIFCSPTKHPSLGSVLLLHSLSDLSKYLARANFPIFAKPLTSSQSLGIVGIAGLDESESQLFLTNGNAMALSDFHDQISQRYQYSGYAFQEMVEMHPDLKEFTNGAVGTFRIVTTTTPDGISVLYAAWKIPGKGSMADNFWREGNLLANVDVGSGEVLRCQKSAGIDAQLIDSSPESGRKIIGLKIPLWEHVKKMTLEVASLLPGERVLGFDVAISPDGPILIEANTNPDHGIYQIAADQGFWTDRNAKLFEWNAEMAQNRKKEIKKDAVREYKAHKSREKTNRKQGLASDASLVFVKETSNNSR